MTFATLIARPSVVISLTSTFPRGMDPAVARRVPGSDRCALLKRGNVFLMWVSDVSRLSSRPHPALLFPLAHVAGRGCPPFGTGVVTATRRRRRDDAGDDGQS